MDWGWVRQAIRGELLAHNATQGLTSLAIGTDQLFANVSLDLGMRLTAVIPFPGYDRLFDGDGLSSYHRLLELCDVVTLPGALSDQASFFDAGRYIVQHCDVLLSVWDEKPAVGFGGTADVVDHARDLGKSIIVLNPITQETSKCK
jgi:hypothetical protein